MSLSSTSPLYTCERHPLGGPLSEGKTTTTTTLAYRATYIPLFAGLYTGLYWDCTTSRSAIYSLHFTSLHLTFTFRLTYNRPARARILYPHCASNTTFQLQRVLAALYLIRPIPDNRNRIPPGQSHQPLWKRSQSQAYTIASLLDTSWARMH
jgi:hypothetical protein